MLESSRINTYVNIQAHSDKKGRQLKITDVYRLPSDAPDMSEEEAKKTREIIKAYCMGQANGMIANA
ncbi:hypothetical protein Barb4_03350 [Bacteroidales bacterium Barb4]|nr:hypothetical protein Barb4_03350 [Bacteroidales bacterium Barb4]